MTCKWFKENMSLYIDNQLDDIESKEFELHLLECNSCRKEYEYMINILKEIRMEEEVELPQNFELELRNKLIKETKDKSKKFNWKVLSGIAASLLIVSFSLMSHNFNMGSKTESIQKEMTMEEQEKYTMMDSDESFGMPESQIEVTYALTNDNNRGMKNVKNDRKIIKNASLNIEIEDYDKVFDEIIKFVKSQNGYIENSQTGYKVFNREEKEQNLKQGYLEIRIPQDVFMDTFNFLKDLGVVHSENIAENDITVQYFDRDNYVKNMMIQEERLREILKQANNVQEILMVENELRRIRTEIDGNTKVLKGWDNQVSMSTISTNLTEVQNIELSIKFDDDSIWTRGKKGFIRTVNRIIEIFEYFVVKVITILPILLAIFIFLSIGYIVRRKHKNRRTKNEK